MNPRIEDYALIGNCETAALVSKSGSIDWLCLPHFDSNACFTRLLGNENHGFWRIGPAGEFRVERRYLPETMVLETTFHTSTGSFRLTDAMIVGAPDPLLVRTLEGLEGFVDVDFEFVVRFDYGSIVPWVNRTAEGFKRAVAGPDSLLLQTSFPTHGENLRTVGRVRLQKNEHHRAALIWQASHLPAVKTSIDVDQQLRATAEWWRKWLKTSTYRDEYRLAVERSLLVLKALTFAPTGGIVAAPTTSLPEQMGGSRNWDYRFSWVRDSTFTLYSLLTTGFVEEAEQWRRWLVRAVAGTPSQVNIMYGIRGERRLSEIELTWLDGFAGSKPVRVGNAAYMQLQLDIFGEVMDTMELARRSGLAPLEQAWELQKEMVRFVCENWREPDEGIWEMRGGRRHYVHSKVMAWTAVDRGIQAIEKFNVDGDLTRWREVRTQIRDEVLREGYNPQLRSFTQAYGSENVDASLLMLPLVGFIEAGDPRMRTTVEKIERDLIRDGLVRRYRTQETADGLTGDEGQFLACSFWLVDYYVLVNERAKARRLFEELLKLPNDVGLLAEEYDGKNKRFLGNFPQALSHIALINSAVNLAKVEGSAMDRSHHT